MMKQSTFVSLLIFAILALLRQAQGNEVLSDVEKLCSRFCKAKSTDGCPAAIPKPDVYAPMDQIEDQETPATGAVVHVRGWPKPSVQPGIFGGSIFLANRGTIDNKFIDLGNMQDRCIDNLSKCSKGLTVSIWFWLSNQNHPWPAIVSASQWSIASHIKPGNVNEPYLLFYKNDRSKLYEVGENSDSTFLNEQWRHIAFVYKSYDDVKLYIDGNLDDATNRFHKREPMSDKNVQIGCHKNGNCVRGKFDELQIWEKALSADDIKALYNKKNDVA